jgi:tripartite-type tricarboxylate transporter receptor subunit TctC
MKFRKSLILVLLIAIVSSFCMIGEAKLDFPKKPIRLIVTFPPGGGNDVIARAFAKAMERHINQPVVIDNISGSGGLAGTLEVVKAKPDGYTILVQDASLNTMFAFQKDIPFGLKDLLPVASVYECPTWILANKERHYKGLSDFINTAKKNPGKLTVGVAGATGSQYLMAAAIKGYLKLDYKIIPYSGGGPLKVALLGNKVDIGVIHSPILLPEVIGGILDVLAAGSPMKGIYYEPLQTTQTLRELKMPFTFNSTRGFLLPKKTPTEIRDFLEGLLKQAYNDPSMSQFAKTFGFSPTWQDHNAYSKFLKAELVQYKSIIKKYAAQ